MNDSHATAPGTGHDTPRDSPPTFSVVEVAGMLGISKDAVRARLHRGTLEGVKVEGAWRVRLPDETLVIDVTKVDRQGSTSSPTAPTSHPTSSATPPQSDAMIAHLEHLEGEVQYLRERLEEADRQRDHLQHQLADERRRTDTLTALSASVRDDPRDDDATVEETTETRLAGILARLKRLIAGGR